MKKKNISVYMILLLLLLLVQNSFSATTIIRTQVTRERVVRVPVTRQRVVGKTGQPRKIVPRAPRVLRTPVYQQRNVVASKSSTKSSVPKNVPTKSVEGKDIVYVPFEKLKGYKETLDKNQQDVANLNVDVSGIKDKLLTIEQEQEKFQSLKNNLVTDNEKFKTEVSDNVKSLKNSFSLMIAILIFVIIGLAIKIALLSKKLAQVRKNVDTEINLLKHSNTKEFEKITQNIKAENRSILDKLHLHIKK